MLRGFLFFHFSLCIKTPIYDTPPWPSLNFICKSPGGGLVWLDFCGSHPELPKIFPDSSSSTFFFSSSWSSPLGDRHHWETSPRKISCQIFKGSIGNNQKLVVKIKAISKLLSASFPQKTKKKHFLVVKMNVSSSLREISNLHKIGSNTSLSEPQVPPPVAVPMAWKKWLLQKNLPKNGKGWKLKPWKR